MKNNQVPRSFSLSLFRGSIMLLLLGFSACETGSIFDGNSAHPLFENTEANNTSYQRVLVAISEASASSDDGNVAANAIDGDPNTRWSAQGEAQWIRFDLGKTAQVKEVDLAWHNALERMQTYQVDVSNDGTNYVVVANRRTSNLEATIEKLDFDVVEARFVRVMGWGNSENMWNSLSEAAVFEYVKSSALTESGPTQPPQEQPPTGGGNMSGEIPSTIINLTNWKLTLPVDTDHAGSPDEIKQPELNDYQSADFFHVGANNQGVVFRAGTHGDTTSGSKYPRSELREMAMNGAANASWSTTAGTHTMFVRQKITSIPNVKPHVVVGQIHDANDDVIMIRLEGKKLFVQRSLGKGSSAQEGPDLDSNYELGREFTIRIVAANGRIQVHHNGVLKVDFERVATGCYFKAGVYTQSNATTEGSTPAFGEAVLYELNVTH